MSRLGPATLVVIIIAILLGLAGAYGVRQYLKPVPAPPAPPPVVEAPKPRKYKVPFAMYDLPANRKLVISDVTSIEMTMEDVKKRKLASDTPLDFRYVLGRTLREPVPANGTFRVSKFFPAGVEPSISDLLKPGQRAVTVPIKGVNATGGFATPGTLVDVMFRTAHSRAERELPIPEVTFTLIDGAEVLALGDSKFPGTPASGSVMSVTLAVSPEQAQMLEVVEGKGDLSLVARAQGTKAEPPAVPDKLSLEKLLGLVPGPAPFTAEIYRGSRKETLIFGERGPHSVIAPAAPVPAVAPPAAN